jgi:hypothetical protein
MSGIQDFIQQLQQLQINVNVTQQWVTVLIHTWVMTYNTRVTYGPLYWSEIRTVMLLDKIINLKTKISREIKVPQIF